MATQLDPNNFGYQNFYSALLTADITSGSLTISLDTVPAPTSGILVIDPDSSTGREIILYTSKGASTITCPADGRGWSGTTAGPHLTGTTVIMAPVDEWFEGLASGVLSTDPLRASAIPNHVVSGGVITQSSGLIGTFSNIVVHLAGRRYTSGAIANKTYTASKDTYVDVSGLSDGSVVITYTEVTLAAASPALPAGSHRLGKVVTSGAAISRIEQVGYDTLGNRYYNTVTQMPSQVFSAIAGYPAGNTTTDNAVFTTRFHKPRDIMTLGTTQIVRWQPFLRTGGTGGVAIYRLSYNMRPTSAFVALEAASGTTVGQTPNYTIVTMNVDVTYTDYWATYDLSAFHQDSILRVDIKSDGAAGGDTNGGPLETEGAVIYYNKDYSKSY
jgi:hypothetical protein